MTVAHLLGNGGKKRTKLPELGGWGECNLGNALKKTFFKEVFPKRYKYNRINLSLHN